MENFWYGVFWGVIFMLIYHKLTVDSRSRKIANKIIERDGNIHKQRLDKFLKENENYLSEKNQLHLENQLLELKLKNQKLRKEIEKNEEKTSKC